MQKAIDFWKNDGNMDVGDLRWPPIPNTHAISVCSTLLY